MAIITTIFANMAYAASELPATMAEPPTNEIWYTTTDGEIITLYETDVFGATIISNKRYTNGHGAIRGVIVFDNAVTEIGEEAFEYCSNLTSVTLPNNVTKIGEHTFSSCGSLESVYCKATTPPTAVLDVNGWEAFDVNADNRKIYILHGSVYAYKNAEGWRQYADDIVGYDF